VRNGLRRAPSTGEIRVTSRASRRSATQLKSEATRKDAERASWSNNSIGCAAISKLLDQQLSGIEQQVRQLEQALVQPRKATAAHVRPLRLSENPAANQGEIFGSVVRLHPESRRTASRTNPIVRLNRARDANECALARWACAIVGKDLTFGTRCINAAPSRCTPRPAFRAAYEGRRCWYPPNGVL